MNDIALAIDRLYEKMKLNPHGLIFPDELVPEAMRDPDISNPYGYGYTGWKMIDSTITDKYISEIEERLNVIIPQSYRQFVKHKFFIELYVQNNAIRFDSLTDEKKLENIVEYNMSEMYVADVLRHGYLCVGDFYDYGAVVVNSNIDDQKVYIVMQDDPRRLNVYTDTFLDLFEPDDKRANEFIDNYNKSML